MRDSDDYMTYLPEFENESTVESEFPIRIGPDPETGGRKLFLQQDLYDVLSAGWWFFNSKAFSISVDGVVVTSLLDKFIPELSVTAGIELFAVSIKCIALAQDLVGRVAFVGKFTFKEVGFGESFGNVFGGGTITCAQ